MVDKNKPLEEYTKLELLDVLNSKKELDSYFLLNQIYEENKNSNKYYSYFDDFLQMIYGKTSFTRMRGFGLCSSLAKWDIENKLDESLPKMLVLLEDDKPTTVRVSISFIMEILKYKPYLSSKILIALDNVNYNKYKDTMAPLVKKDVNKLKEYINNL